MPQTQTVVVVSLRTSEYAIVKNPFGHRNVRSVMGAYAGAARRRVHLVILFIRPPSGYRPGRRRARHAHIPQIGLHMT